MSQSVSINRTDIIPITAQQENEADKFLEDVNQFVQKQQDEKIITVEGEIAYEPISPRNYKWLPKEIEKMKEEYIGKPFPEGGVHLIITKKGYCSKEKDYDVKQFEVLDFDNRTIKIKNIQLYKEKDFLNNNFSNPLNVEAILYLSNKYDFYCITQNLSSTPYIPFCNLNMDKQYAGFNHERVVVEYYENDTLLTTDDFGSSKNISVNTEPGLFLSEINKEYIYDNFFKMHFDENHDIHLNVIGANNIILD